MNDMDYINQIQQLVDLQKVDDDIFVVKKELENAPLHLVRLRETFAEVEGRRNRVLDKLAHMEDQNKRLTNEIEEDSARLKKSKNKMMQVGNEREHQAIVREMDTLERNSRSREEERVTLLDEIQAANEQLAEIDVEYNAIKEDLDAKTATMDSSVLEAQDRLQVLDRKRQAASGSISKPVFMRYEFIRERLDHPVIVSVRDGICSGCHIAIPPQTYIELQRGQQILSCPNCQRLIFWNEHFPSADDAPVTRQNAAESGQDAGDEDLPWDDGDNGQEEEGSEE